jgi:hypothetical protein
MAAPSSVTASGAPTQLVLSSSLFYTHTAVALVLGAVAGFEMQIKGIVSRVDTLLFYFFLPLNKSLGLYTILTHSFSLPLDTRPSVARLVPAWPFYAPTLPTPSMISLSRTLGQVATKIIFSFFHTVIDAVLAFPPSAN